MEMENTRRPSLDRSRELKKPRLGASEAQPNPNGRPFPLRPPPPGAAGAPPASARFRAGNDRASEGSNDSSRTEAYQPQPQSYHELVNQYNTALSELTFNSKPIITNLTIIAGENLPAAKGIVATVCTNILEVPSEQKLPSLYLLDSIVKNIGRDYIRYFAARLPEVFCKAYRQVDPSVHPSMRHLFGTWKGVFPPQTLQMIEKELGFASAMNGSGAATSRPDSLSQRPQHSIHVNPKYLERQRLQQSSGRAKGGIDDEPLPGTNPIEDTERLDRASVIDTGRTWVDSSAKLNNIQHPHGEVLSEPLHDKKNSGVYGDFGYGSSGSRNSSLGIVRMGRTVADPGNGRPWYGASSGITETVLGQRNGLTTKHGLSNYPTPRSSDVAVQLQPVSSVASRSISRMSANWKNSEEEEFMWDMHSRLSEEDAAKVSSTRDRWTPDDSEKVDFDDNLPKARSLLDTGSRFEGDASSDSLFTEQKETTFGMSSPYRLQELQSSDKLVDSVTSTAGMGHAGGYSSSLRSLAGSAVSSLTRMTPRLSSASALSGSMGTMVPQRGLHPSISSSPTGQSFMRQNSPSPLFPARYPQQQLLHTTEHNFPPSCSFPPLDNNLPKISGKILPVNIQLGKVQKTQPEDLLASSPSGPAFQLSQKHPLSEAAQSISKESDHVGPPPMGHQNSVSASIATSKSDNSTPERSDPCTEEISGQSSTSSLLAAVMESGILTKLKTDGLPNRSVHDVGQAPVSSSVEPPLLKGPPSSLVTSSRSEVKSACLAAPLVRDDTSVISDTSQSKDESPSVPPGPTTSAQAADVTASPISSLLSSLVAKGFISASKEETLNLLPVQKPAQPENQKPRIISSNTTPVSSVPISSVPLGVVNKASALGSDLKTSDALLQNSSVMAESLIGLEFRPDVLRELHPPVIDAVLNDLPQQCNICGLRLKIKEQLDRHLEWHALKKAEPDGETKVTRRWYANAKDWVSGKAGVPLCIHLSECLEDYVMDADEPMVLADDDQCVCVLCGELFEDYYSQEKNTWLFKGALHMMVSVGDAIVGSTYESGKGPIVHASCISESPDNDFGIQAGAKLEKDA